MPPKKMRKDSKVKEKPSSTSDKNQNASEPMSESEEEEEEEGGFRVGGVYIPPAPPAVCSTENTGPRLIISHIVNTNFKSYAGTQILGPFHKSFTSIIGPNGSGKSNVIDSMLFVFGYRATKIRSKKISVLLHKSENHRDIKSATVEVHFIQINDKDGEEYDEIPGSEIVISRTAFHDNSSFYTINGKRSQFKEVALILRKHGIDLVHNRFLILQGEVEQIAMMKPKAQTEHETGMLEYLEDIIGTARYKTPLRKLESKLNQLNDERLERANRAKIVEKEREALRAPMEEAIDFLSLENEHTIAMNLLLQLKLLRATKKIEGLEAEKKILDEAMAEVLAKLKAFRDQQLAMDKDVCSKEKELEALKKQKDTISDALAKNENAITKTKGEIANTTKARKKAIEAKKQEELKFSELENVPEKNEREIEELKGIAEKLKVDREKEEKEVEGVLAGLQAETQELQDKKDVLLTQLMGLRKTKDTAKAAYDVAKTEVSLYQIIEKSEKAKLEKLINTKEGNTKRLEEKKAMKAQIEEKLPDAERRLGEAFTELQTLKQDEVKMTQELHSKRASIEEKRSSVNAFRSRNKVLNFIMQKKADGVVPGVFGRLGDLGGIAPKYDCAVSTACGLLDHIVTDTVDTASKCLELLKQFDVGRGNFIALEKQQWLRNTYEQPFRAPENVPRLFDLIKVQDERIKPAFYFALRDTLVADDLSQARRVAYGATRYRVTTIDGEIIEIAGTMSGGGRDKRTGRMGSSATVTTDVNPAEMSRMEQKVAELQEKLTEMHDRIREREDTVSTLTRDTRKWKIDLNGANAEIKDLLQDEPTLARRIKEQEVAVAAAAPDPAKVYELTTKVDSLKEEFETASAESDQVQKEVDKFTAQIKAITGGRMKDAQKKLDDVTKKLDKVTAEITKLTVEIKTSKRNSKKSLSKIQQLTAEITEAENTLKTCEAQLEKLKEDCVGDNEKLKEFSSKIKIEEGAIKEIKTKITDIMKESNQIKSAKIDEDQKLEELKRKLSEAKSVPPTLRNELSKLKLNQIPFRPPVDDLITYTPEQLAEHDEQSVQITQLTKHDQLKKLTPNLAAVQEFNEKDEVYQLRLNELNEVNEKRYEVRMGFDEVRKARLNEFMEGFTIISSKLKEMYQTITLGGDAEFDLLDSLDPFSEGVSFSVRPPKKSWKNISNLSGGEKTLSSLALVFALHYYKPSPLYVMDEIDAALDFKNVSIVGHYIKERTKNAQFIIISLRSNMFELADLLVGIYKTYNCTKSVTITPGKYACDA
uniref:Structural maintenance of chromosomes protein n=1 Tax=Lygus hesperus TaxID=30085 RepID=A0A146KK78_LYGHE